VLDSCRFQQYFVTDFYDSSTSPLAKDPTLDTDEAETQATEIGRKRPSTRHSTRGVRERAVSDPELPRAVGSKVTAMGQSADGVIDNVRVNQKARLLRRSGLTICYASYGLQINRRNSSPKSSVAFFKVGP